MTRALLNKKKKEKERGLAEKIIREAKKERELISQTNTERRQNAGRG